VRAGLRKNLFFGGFEMPAKSQRQRAALNAKYGHGWVKAHHFDNRGKLPKTAPRARKR
jgi:hypothetical protein